MYSRSSAIIYLDDRYSQLNWSILVALKPTVYLERQNAFVDTGNGNYFLLSKAVVAPLPAQNFI